ncbi:peptidase s41 family protein [Colletotrichum incanum]|uniref:Peptidase s41 family protein n=1 Tax=Colletotrichum incanum TaxID=1573173 RepID=A0A161Y5P0_COLIC|nr:peptidase s41 family protein [Colletotrichum incanum]
MVFAMLLLAGTTLMAAQCAVDNCLRALIATQTPERRLASAQAFCANFTRAPAAANTSIPSYASEHCGGTSGPEASSRFVFLPNALTRVFQFGRPFALVSPVSIPVIQTFDEVKAIGDNVRIVSRINGVDASEFVQNPVDQASSSRDLDTAYNWIFNSKHNVPYPGENTTVENTTGKLSSAANFASIQVPFVNITDGESFYQTFCALGLSALPGGPPASTATSKRKIVQFGLYPEPVVKSYDGTISGYLLDDEGLKDVAILNVASFSTRSSKIFQKTVNSLSRPAELMESRKSSTCERTSEDGHDLFRRFFPYIEQGALTHRRENDHFLTIAKGIFTAEENMVPSDGDWRSLSQRANYRADLNMTKQPFTSFDA